MSLRRNLAGLAFAATAALLSAPVHAVVVLPGAFGYEEARYFFDDGEQANYFHNLRQDFAGADLEVGFSDVGASATNTLSGAPTPKLTSNASIIGSSNQFVVDSQSKLTYYFAALGPGDAIVPVNMLALLEYSGSGNGFGRAFVNVFLESDHHFVLMADSGPTVLFGCVCGSTNINTTLNLHSNEVYGVFMGSIATAAGHELFGGGSGFGMVDPSFSIDAAFLAANPGFSLQFSEGIGNTPPPGSQDVPEPATWALMLGGFGLSGWALRRRRAPAAPPSSRPSPTGGVSNVTA